jgi:hypothetical protein
MTTKGPSASDLATTLGRQVELLVARVRPYRSAEWEAPSANPSWSNADTVFHLVDALTAFTIGVERRADPGRPEFPAPQRPPATWLPGELAAVAGRLVEALGKTDAQERVWHPRHRFSARTMAAVALSEVVLHRWDVIGPGDRGPEPRAARLVLQGLFASQDDSSANPIALLLHVAGRVPLEGRRDFPGPDWDWELPDEVAADRRRA